MKLHYIQSPEGSWFVKKEPWYEVALIIVIGLSVIVGILALALMLAPIK